MLTEKTTCSNTILFKSIWTKSKETSISLSYYDINLLLIIYFLNNIFSFFAFCFVPDNTQPGLLYVHVFVASYHTVLCAEFNKIK